VDRRIATALCALLLLTACGPTEGIGVGVPGATAEPTATPTPTPEPTAEPARAPDCDDLLPEPEVDGPLADDPDVADAQRKRADLGIASDEATVREVLATTEAPYGFGGTPLTQTELEALIARNQGGVDPGELRAWADAEAGDRVAGLWIDHTIGGVPTVAFTGDVEDLRASAAERFGDEVVVATAEHTLAELVALQQEISPALGGGGADGEIGEGDLTSSGILEDRNRVSVGAIGGEDTAVAISERFGTDRICLELRPVPGPDQAEISPWAPVGEPDPTATAIPIEVYAQGCASGEPATGRVAEPEIAYDDDAVVVTMRIIPPMGDQSCPSHPPTPFTLELDEPLGDRLLLDGGQDPPGPPQRE
jgi:hypothetical protein